MPFHWKAGMIVLVACLVAAMAIGIVRLATTPTEILGDGFRGLPARHAGCNAALRICPRTAR
jgi:hypothetical protein